MICLLSIKNKKMSSHSTILRQIFKHKKRRLSPQLLYPVKLVTMESSKS